MVYDGLFIIPIYILGYSVSSPISPFFSLLTRGSPRVWNSLFFAGPKMGEDVGRVQVKSKKLVEEGDSTSRSSGWIDIFRVDRHLQAIQTRPSNKEIRSYKKPEPPKRKGNLPSPIGIRVSATSKKTSPRIGHISETITQPITRWWLSFNPFENYANVKLDHLFPPRIGVKIQKKTFETTTQPVVQSAKWPKWNVPPAVPAILSPLASLLELPSSLVLHSPGYPAKNPQTKIGYKTFFWGKKSDPPPIINTVVRNSFRYRTNLFPTSYQIMPETMGKIGNYISLWIQVAARNALRVQFGG